MVITILLSIVGWIITIMLASKQHSKNIELQKKQFKIELGVTVASKGLDYTHDALGKINQVQTSISGLLLLEPLFGMNYSTFENKITWWKKETETIRGAWGYFCESYLSLLMFMESKEVILNRFVNMRRELQDAFGTLSQEINQFFSKLNTYSAVDYSNKRIDVNFSQLTSDITVIQSKACDILSYLFDLQVSLQNEFYSEIFDYKVTERKPTNYDFRVLKVN